MTGKRWIIIIAGVAAAAGVVVALVALINVIWPPPTEDFEVLVEPENGTVPAGGTMTTRITVDGRHGYRRQVRLNASGQPVGVLISLSPDKGVTNPKYVSTATITVDKDVSAGSHEIRITATADNGDERLVDFGLIVRRPDDDTGGFRLPKVEIEKPADGSTVDPVSEVEGLITGQIPNGWYMWVLLNPHPSSGQYWAQGAAIVPFGGKWRTRVHMNPADKGEKYDIFVYLVDSSLNEKYVLWVAEGTKDVDYPPLDAPVTGKAHILAKTTVTLGE